VKALPFKGTGKHKYSFRHIEVPSYPIHFCDCEEHCGPPEAANDEYASVLDAAAYEKERSIMNSVMSKLFEKENDHLDSMEIQNHGVDFDAAEPSNARNELQMDKREETSEEDLDDQMEETEDPSEEELDDLVLNIVTCKPKSSVAQLNSEKQAADKVCTLQVFRTLFCDELLCCAVMFINIFCIFRTRASENVNNLKNLLCRRGINPLISLKLEIGNSLSLLYQEPSKMNKNLQICQEKVHMSSHQNSMEIKVLLVSKMLKH
jgi:hypothetical protein